MIFKKQIIIILVLFIICNSVFAQINLTGVVVDATTKEAIPGANVFINNTSFKTVTNAQGSFNFGILNLQKGELIVNALGYKFVALNINTITEKNITIPLTQQPKELDVVIVQQYEKDGFKKWGKTFISCFIGNTHEAEDCTIKNTKDLKFYYNKKTGVLNAVAQVPIKIINKKLGYEIDYTLEEFEFNMSTKMQFYSGYPVFTNMKGGKRKRMEWEANRRNCYLGSIMHFMRALYINQLDSEKFIIQKAKKVLNKPKAELKAKMKMAFLNGTQSYINVSGNDSINQILQQPDSIFAILTKPLPADSFAFALDSLTAGLFFENHLAISYTKQHNNTLVTSFVKLLVPETISIFQNGAYYNSMYFFTQQYWAQTEKMARTLPFDYEYFKPTN